MTKRNLIRIGGVIALGLAAYFINVEIQSHLGRKALRATGLEPHGLDEALGLARTDDKLVLADLSAIWCPTCRTFDRKVLGDEQVRRVIQADYIFARIEYESEAGQAFLEKYQLRGFPNLLLLDAEGGLVRRLHLTMDPSVFLNNLSGPG